MGKKSLTSKNKNNKKTKSKKNNSRKKYGGNIFLSLADEYTNESVKEYIDNFQNKEKVKKIYFYSNNGLTELPDLTMFKNTLSLVITNLHKYADSATLSKIDVNNIPKKIKDITISYTNIESLSDFDKLDDLEKLNLDKNKNLKNIDKLPINLKVFYCMYSRISYLPKLYNLEELYLDTNPYMITLPVLPLSITKLYIRNSCQFPKIQRNANISTGKIDFSITQKEIKEINSIIDNLIQEKLDKIHNPEIIKQKMLEEFGPEWMSILEKARAQSIESNPDLPPPPPLHDKPEEIHTTKKAKLHHKEELTSDESEKYSEHLSRFMQIIDKNNEETDLLIAARYPSK